MGNTVTKETPPESPSFHGRGSFSLSSHGQNSSSRRLTDSRKDREIERQRRHAKRKEAYQLIIDPSETVDGGYLFPQGVYYGPQDFKVAVVRDLIIRRKLAPFYKGLDSLEPEWSDAELLEAVNGEPVSGDVPEIDNLAIEDEPPTSKPSTGQPIPSRNGAGSLSTAMDSPMSLPKIRGSESVPVSRDRSYTTSAYRQANERQQAEKNIQQIWLYRNAHECPICFLYYPRLNSTRCCGQDICTECFVQIKRSPPHPPYSDESPSTTATGPQVSGPDSGDVIQLVSEPACCPYCAEEGCGVIFDAPPFEWGIHKPQDQSNQSVSAAPQGVAGSPSRRRRTSVPATHPDVVTIDIIRPDWGNKLASAQRKLARKSAAARALHQSALLPAGGSSSSRIHDSDSGGAARGSLADIVHASRRMSASQTRELEKRMIDEAIKASLSTQ